MAWLQSSFTNHQLLTESSTKGDGVSKQSSDKSHRPLLDNSPGRAAAEDDNKDSLRNASSFAERKIEVPPKSNFLSRSFFDRNLKGKNPVNSNSVCVKNSPENKGLLSQQRNLFSSEDTDSEDELCMPRNGQYQRVADY